MTRHVDGLRVDSNACCFLTASEMSSVFLKIFPSSVLTSYDLTSTWCSTRALNHLPDLSVGFTRTISPLLRGEAP